MVFVLHCFVPPLSFSVSLHLSLRLSLSLSLSLSISLSVSLSLSISLCLCLCSVLVVLKLMPPSSQMERGWQRWFVGSWTLLLWRLPWTHHSNTGPSCREGCNGHLITWPRGRESPPGLIRGLRQRVPDPVVTSTSPWSQI